jgi:uncharacterized protein (TIGR03435 family)
MRIAVLSLFSMIAFGQAAPPLEFEVASVKPAAPLGGRGPIRLPPRGGPGTADPGRMNFVSISLKNLLMTAYGVKIYQVSGPSWLDTERYDIVASVPPGTTKEQANVMLQNLIEERFQLTLHRETKDLPLYELGIGKNGPKLKEFVNDPTAPPAQPPTGPMTMGKDGFPVLPPGTTAMMVMNGRMRMIASKQPIARLADMLANQLGRPVVDKTGLTGEYDYKLEFSSEGLSGGAFGGLPPPPPPPPGTGGPAPVAAGPADTSDAPGLLAAVQEQLGLRLDQKKGPLDLLVIDRAEKVPTEN